MGCDEEQLQILRRLRPKDKDPSAGAPCAPLDDKRNCEYRLNYRLTGNY